MVTYHRASDRQIARVLDLAEITGIGIEWLSAWYRMGFDRPLSEMDSTTARAIIFWVSHWPVRVQAQETRR